MAAKSQTHPANPNADTKTEKPLPRRRLWPAFLLILCCWALVGRDPAARRGVARAWKQPFASRLADGNAQFEFDSTRFNPQDRRVQLDLLARRVAALVPPKTANPASSVASRGAANRGETVAREAEREAEREAAWRGIEAQTRELRGDATGIALLVRARLAGLSSNRVAGTFTNPNFPAAPPQELAQTPDSPRAAWDSLLELSRRGQHLQPQNTYFDWMAIYALLAMRRDEEARGILKLAAHKTAYQSPNRTLVLNRLALMRELWGSPLEPRDFRAARAVAAFPEPIRIRQSARWLLEGAITDRLAGRHARALDTARDLIALGRILREKGDSLSDNAVGTVVEIYAMSRFLPRVGAGFGPRATRFNSALGVLKGSPISIYPYAQSQKRADVTRLVNLEWPRLKEYSALWRSIGSAQLNGQWPPLALTASDRERSLILHILPSAAVLTALFWALRRRYPDTSGARHGGAWIGWWLGVPLLALAAEFDFFFYFRPAPATALTHHFDNVGVLASLPFWVYCGTTLTLVSAAASSAVTWQKRQAEPRQSLRSQLQWLFAPPTDGLSRLDFEKVLKLSAQGTGFALLAGAIAAPIFNFTAPARALGIPAAALQNALIIGAITISNALLVRSWHRRPRRRQTLHLAWRLILESLVAFLLASSLCYAVLALATRPAARRLDRQSQRAIERGEVQIARDELGLKP